MLIVSTVRTGTALKLDLMLTYNEFVFQIVQTLAFTSAQSIVFYSFMYVMVTMTVVMGQMKKTAVHVRQNQGC